MKAYISLADESEIFSVDDSLKIGGNIGFFEQPILRECRFEVNAVHNWQLTFFAKTKFETKLRVSFSTHPEKFKGNTEAKAIWVNKKIDMSAKSPDKVEAIETISQFIRGSSTLSASDYIKTSESRYFVSDKNAIGYISTDQNQFERIVICLALSVAYRSAIQSFLCNVSTSLQSRKSHNELTKLYKQIIFFNLAHYSKHPIKPTNSELPHTWDAIRDEWRLDCQNEELTQQIATVGELLRTESERKLNFRMAFFGIALTILSTLSLTEITPTDFSEFGSSWKKTISNFLSTEPTKTKKP